MAKRDRFYIEDKVRELLNQKIKKDNFLNMNSAKNKEIFLFAVSLGIDAPNSLEGSKDGLLLDKDLDVFDESMVYSVTIPNFENMNDIANKNAVYDYIEKCANQGFRVISSIIDNSSIETIDKQLLIELNEKFEDVVKAEV